MAEPPPSLATLPAEIQQNIYRHLFSGRKFSKYVLRDRITRSAAQWLEIWKKFTRPIRTDGSLDPNPLSITLACKACHAQARPALFEYGVIDATDFMPGSVQGMRELRTTAAWTDLQQARHLHVQKSGSVGRLEVFGTLPRLRRLSLGVDMIDYGRILWEDDYKDGKLTEEGRRFLLELLHPHLGLGHFKRERFSGLIKLLRLWSEMRQKFKLEAYVKDVATTDVGDQVLDVRIDFDSGLLFISATEGGGESFTYDVPALIQRLSQYPEWSSAD